MKLLLPLGKCFIIKRFQDTENKNMEILKLSHDTEGNEIVTSTLIGAK